MELAGLGVWSSQLRYGDASEAADAAAELDELGFTARWIPDVGGPVLDAVGRLLAATKQTVVATGILNLWMHSADEVAASYAALTAEHGVISGRTRRRPAAGAHRAAGSGRAGPEDAGVVRTPRPRRSPLLGHA